MSNQKIKPETTVLSEIMKSQNLNINQMEKRCLGMAVNMMGDISKFLEMYEKIHPEKIPEIENTKLLMANAGLAVIDLFDNQEEE